MSGFLLSPWLLLNIANTFIPPGILARKRNGNYHLFLRDKLQRLLTVVQHWQIKSHKRFSEWYLLSGSGHKSCSHVPGDQLYKPPSATLAVGEYPNQTQFPGGTGFKSLKVEWIRVGIYLQQTDSRVEWASSSCTNCTYQIDNVIEKCIICATRNGWVYPLVAKLKIAFWCVFCKISDRSRYMFLIAMVLSYMHACIYWLTQA